jgi:hypothetical protein
MIKTVDKIAEKKSGGIKFISKLSDILFIFLIDRCIYS